MKNKIILPVLFAGLALAPLGCASGGSLLANPSKSHVVQVAVKAIDGGIVVDPVTGQNTLGYRTGYVTVTTIPVVTSQTTNGQVVMCTPDVATAFEVSGKSGIFGSAGSSYRLATGNNGMNTLLINAPPINEGFYGTNNMLTYVQPSVIGSPVPFITSTNGSQQPIVINPLKP